MDLKQTTVSWLEEFGVTVDIMADLLLDLQRPYNPNLSIAACAEHIEGVLEKREVQHAVLTAIEIDRLAQEGLLREPIASIITSDEGRYGVDENLAVGITATYGSIALSNFGYLDKVKPGIIGTLDTKKGGPVATFVDDIVCALVAAAAARLAHAD